MNILPEKKDPTEDLAELFQILSQPSRLRIVEALGGCEACVCHLEALLGERQAYISQQLTFLKDAGLVDFRREGRNIYYHLTNGKLLEVIHSANMFLGHPQEDRNQNEPVPGCPCPHCNPGVKDCPLEDCN
jgi:DNA-binding transcriptional ArsR family regulator